MDGSTDTGTFAETSGQRRRFSHPLQGSDLKTLLSVLATYGPPDSGRARARFAAAGLAAVARSPFSWLEQAWVAATQRFQPPLEAPVFIVGHWRSGTTHLYNVLGRSSQFGYVSPLTAGLPWDFLILGRLLRPFLERAIPRDRVIDNIPVMPDSPQEDEIALASMTLQSFFHGLYFPRHLRANIGKHVFFDDCSEKEVQRWAETFRYFLGKVSRLHKGRRLLIKNPVHTARIARLVELFPDAKFIHIHRHPCDVFRSTRNFYGKLLPWLALQSFASTDIDDVILDTYTRMMQRVAEDSTSLPSHQFAEISFGDLEQDPIAQLRRVYEQLQLGNFSNERPGFETYLTSVSGYSKNIHPRNRARDEEVVRRTKFILKRWGYTAQPRND